MSKNGNKTSKKLFEKDGPGGPGRGNVKDNLEDLDVWQATEQIIRKQMASGKGSDQLKASQVYLKWLELKKQHDKEQEKTLPDDTEIKNIRELLATKFLIDVMSINWKMDFFETVNHIEDYCVKCQILQAKE